MSQEYYWSLVLEDGWVQAAVWTIEERQARVISVSSSLVWEAAEDLVEVVNAALSNAVQDFPDEASEPKKTVFGVPPSWVSEGQINKEHLGKIREICSKLSLTPSGFVILPESIAHSVKIKEGSPLTGVVVGLGKSVLDVTIFRLGNLVGTVNVGRSVSVADDVGEGLARFSMGEHMPSRFLVYDGRDAELEEVKQVLVKTDWESRFGEKFKFLHTPQIETVDVKNKMMAVCLAGASELGEIEGVSLEKERDERDEEEKQVEANIDRSEEVDVADVGFVLGEDVRKTGEREIPREDVVSERKVKVPIRMNFSGLKSLVLKFVPSRRRVTLPTARMPARLTPKRLGLVGMIGLVVGIVGLGVAWWYLPRAEVAVYITPKTLEQTEMVAFDEGVDVADYEDMVLPAETVSVEVSGEKSASTSGSKLIGEKAKGKVTIRNGTASGVEFDAGTEIVGPNDLKFSLDESASVSAASTPSSPGTLTLEVTAGDIGAEYNLAKGEVFTIGNYPKSDVDGVVEEDFSGGSSQEIVAISQEDLDGLSDALEDELSEKGEGKLAEAVPEGKVLIDGVVRTEIVSRDFSGKVGDEASSVELSLSVEVIGLVVSDEVMEKLTAQVLAGQVPGGYTLREEQVKLDFELEDESDGYWEFQAGFEANLLPEINPDEIARKVAGKYPPRAQEYLSSIAGFSRAEIRLSPRLPGRLGVIPRILKHITVEVVADR